MRVELINTGTELLLGSVLNTHLRLFADALLPLGLRLQRQVTVPDGPAITEALAESARRADILLVTGGLGPTTDDITREAVAAWLGLELIVDAALLRAIEQRFASRQITMSPRNVRQAERPRDATVLPNPHGTAPGLYLPPMRLPPAPGAPGFSPHLFLLPGPPRELQPMLHHAVLPILRQIVPPPGDLEMRVLRIAGLGESLVEERIGRELLALGLELGYCARPSEVDVRLFGSPAQLSRGESIVRATLGDAVVSNDQRSLEQVVVELLRQHGRTLATAESCTGGALANRLTNVPGASRVFLAGFVTYANEAKIRDLGVDPALLASHGAVSGPVAAAMAEGARNHAATDFALSTTGIAGPDGGTAGKPVGTVFIALAAKGATPQIVQHTFPRDRETFKVFVVQTALELLRQKLIDSARAS